MADEKISAMANGSPAQAADAIPIQRSTSNLSLTVAELFTADVHGTYSDYTPIADPSAPSTTLRDYSGNVGGRYVPKYIGPSNASYAVQASLMANNVVMWLPGSSSTASIAWGTVWTVATTQATATIANTNFMTQMRRATFTTTTTAANTSGVRSSLPVCWIGSAAGQGGFFFAARLGILTYSSTMRILCGLSALSTALATDPSSTASTCGLSKDTGETVWQCITVDATGGAGHFTKISTTRTTQAAGTTDVFDFFMYCAPNGSTITFCVVDIASGTVYVNNSAQTSTLPANTAMLYAHCESQNVTGGAGTAVAVFLNKIYLETDT